MSFIRAFIAVVALALFSATAHAAIDMSAARAALERREFTKAALIATDSLADHPFSIEARKVRAEAVFHWGPSSAPTYDFEFLQARHVNDPRLMAMHAMAEAARTSNDFAAGAERAEREILSKARVLAPKEPWVVAATWMMSLNAQPKDGGKKGMAAWLSADSLLLRGVVRAIDGVRHETTFDLKPYKRFVDDQEPRPVSSKSNFDKIAEAWPSLAAIDRNRSSGDHLGTIQECDTYLATHKRDDWHVSTVLFWKAEAQYQLLKLRDALATCRQTLEQYPAFPEVYLLRSRILESLGEPEPARHAAEVALELRVMQHSLRFDTGDWPYWKAVAHHRLIAGDLGRALEASQFAEKGARFMSSTKPHQITEIELDRGRILTAMAAKPYVKGDGGALGLLMARGWLRERGSDEMPDVPGSYVAGWSSDSTADVIDSDGIGLRLDLRGVGFMPLGEPQPAAKKGAPPAAQPWRLPRMLPDGTLVYEFGTSRDRRAMRASPKGEFYIGTYDLVTWEGAYVGSDGLRIDPPYRFGLPPAVTEQTLSMRSSVWKDPNGYYDECTQYRMILPDSSVRYMAFMKRSGEYDRYAQYNAISIPGEGLYVGSLIPGGSQVPWNGVLYTNDNRVLGYMRAARVMEATLGKASKGDFNEPKVDYNATYYWTVTPEGAVKWERNVSGVQRYKFWSSGLWGYYDERDKPDPVVPVNTSSAVAEADEPDDRGGKITAFDFKGAMKGGGDTCGRCNGRGRVWGGSYMGSFQHCERAIGGELRCYNVTRENMTGMRTCPMCGGTGRR